MLDDEFNKKQKNYYRKKEIILKRAKELTHFSSKKSSLDKRKEFIKNNKVFSKIITIIGIIIDWTINRNIGSIVSKIISFIKEFF